MYSVTGKRPRPYSDTAASLHGVHVEFVIQFGEPEEEIVREAHAAGASLVAMATHRRSGIARIVKGSVAEQVETGGPPSR